MINCQITRLAGAAAVAAWVLLSGPLGLPSATAEPCPDVEVVFARGTNEAPGLGPTGEAFVTSLRSQANGRNVAVYPVNYPASLDFNAGVDGVLDASNHIRSTVTTCPQTRLVLGGHSQGAAVMGFVTADKVPDGLPDEILELGVPNPMSPQVADHVAAVALFGTPSNRFMESIGMPAVQIGPLYAPKVIQMCAPGDVVCSDEGDYGAHGSYPMNGLPNDAAAFAVSRL